MFMTVCTNARIASQPYCYAVPVGRHDVAARYLNCCQVPELLLLQLTQEKAKKY
jgi:hypothetical protein